MNRPALAKNSEIEKEFLKHATSTVKIASFFGEREFGEREFGEPYFLVLSLPPRTAAAF